jgi:hypothetical protein
MPTRPAELSGCTGRPAGQQRVQFPMPLDGRFCWHGLDGICPHDLEGRKQKLILTFSTVFMQRKDKGDNKGNFAKTINNDLDLVFFWFFFRVAE